MLHHYANMKVTPIQNGTLLSPIDCTGMHLRTDMNRNSTGDLNCHAVIDVGYDL